MEKTALFIKTTLLEERQAVRQKLLNLIESKGDKEFILLEEYNKHYKDVVEVAQEFPRLSQRARIWIVVMVSIGIFGTFVLTQAAAMALYFWIDSAVVRSWVQFAAVLLYIFLVVKLAVKWMRYVPDTVEDRWGNLKCLSVDEYYIRTENIRYLIGKIDEDIARLKKEIAELNSFYAKNS